MSRWDLFKYRVSRLAHKAWMVLKKYGKYILAGLAILLGAGWIWRRNKEARLSARDLAVVDNATEAVKRLQDHRKTLRVRVETKSEDIEKVDRMIETQKKVIRESLSVGAGMSAKEIEEAFARRGI